MDKKTKVGCIQPCSTVANLLNNSFYPCSIDEANIDSETCSARWHAGEKMDWQAAVSALF